MQGSNILANRAFNSALIWIQFPVFNIHKRKTKDAEFVITTEAHKGAMASIASFTSQILVSAIDLLNKHRQFEFLLTINKYKLLL